MSLPDLASLEDVADRLGRDLTVDEQRIVTRLLTDASAAVRLYTGQDFSLVTDDVVTLRIRNGKARLPQRPVVAVTSATFAAITGTQTPAFFWFDGIQTIILNPNVPDLFGWEPFRFDVPTVRVTYTHGYTTDELPPALVGLVVQIVGRALGTELINSGIRQESIDNYQYALGSAGAAGGFGLLPAEKDALDRFRRQGGVVQVGP